MRALWWLIKLGWRTATRVRAFLGPADPGDHPTAWLSDPGPDVMGDRLDVDEAALRANLATWLEAQPRDVQGSAHELAAAYARSFCGSCGAGPHSAKPRCQVCVRRLEGVLAELHGDERRRFGEIARRVREGSL